MLLLQLAGTESAVVAADQDSVRAAEEVSVCLVLDDSGIGLAAAPPRDSTDGDLR